MALFVKAAIAVMNESSATPNHLERVAFARTILTGGLYSEMAVFAVLSNPVIQQKLEDGISIDGDLEFVINSIYNAMAGISAQ